MSALPDPLAQLPAGLLWRGDRLANVHVPVQPSGHPALDALLPGGGWPAGALIELLCDRPGIGELSLLLPLMRQVAAPRWLACIAPPFTPYAPALAAAGVALERLLWIAPATPQDARWSIRQALASGSCGLVLAWIERADMAALRRLQLAAENSATPLFLFRPQRLAGQASPAVLRLQLEAAGSEHLAIRVLKRRGPACNTRLHVPIGRPAPASPLRNASAGSGTPTLHRLDTHHALVSSGTARSAAGGTSHTYAT